MTTTNVNSGAI